MSKVLKFPAGTTKEEWARGAIDMLMSQGERAAILIKAKDGTVISGYWNCNYAEKQILLGHMQVDIIDAVVQATYGLERE